MGKGIPCRCAGDCGRGRCASGDPEEGDGTEPWAWVGRDTAARACRAGETGRAGTSCWLLSVGRVRRCAGCLGRAEREKGRLG